MNGILEKSNVLFNAYKLLIKQELNSFYSQRYVCLQYSKSHFNSFRVLEYQEGYFFFFNEEQNLLLKGQN